MIERIVKFYFSPTDTTKATVNTIADAIADELNIDEILDYNFTTPRARKAPARFKETDLVILGAPTFVGRIPDLLLPYLEKIRGNGAKGVAVALFGNRAYDDALIQISEIMKSGHIQVLAGGAFVGEHSSSKILGKGRPDLKDLTIADEFGRKIGKKIQGGDYSTPEIKGNWPLPSSTQADVDKKNDPQPVKPKTDKTLCINCKICAEVCPTGAIDYDDVSRVPGTCIKCCACKKKCPTHAKYFDDEEYLRNVKKLEDLFARRAEPEYFI